MIQKYTKVFRVGDRNVSDVLEGNVIVEEKLDGSQFRIYIKNGVLQFGSHRVNYDETNIPDKLFNKAITEAEKVFDGVMGEWMIYAEYLKKPKHNTLSYERVPKHHLCVFDVWDMKSNEWFSYDEKKKFVEGLGLEVPQLIYQGNGKEITSDKLDEWVNNTKSMLGNQIIEGVVIKNYNKTHSFDWCVGFPKISKYVREKFKEMNHKRWGEKKDPLTAIEVKYKSEARWDKAIQRLREEGKLTMHMRDLQFLIPSVQKDILEEEGEVIKEELWKAFKKRFMKSWTQGLPQYYQKWLFDQGVEKDE